MSELSGKKTIQSPSLKARALRLLSLREYSRKGLAAKLAESKSRWKKMGAEADHTPVSTAIEIEAVLDDFEARGWLSNERFAEALVRKRSERYGVRKIQDELERSGIDAKESNTLIGVLRESEFRRAYDLWIKKYGILAKDPKERARQYRFLASKGFGSDIVAKILCGQRPD